MHSNNDDCIDDVILHQLKLTSDEFYNRIKSKPTEVLVRYEKLLKPKNNLDLLCYWLDYKRNLRHGEVQRVLEERKKYSK